MFKFLKEKISSWVGKSKKKVEEQAEVVEEPKEKIEEPIEKPVEEPIKKEKKETKKPSKKPKPSKEKRSVPTIEKLQEEKTEIKEIYSKLEQEHEELQPRTAPTIEKLKEKKVEEEKQTEKEKGFFAKIKEKISYKITQEDFDELFEDLEFSFLENNVALEVIEDIKKSLSESLVGKQIKKQELEQEIKQALKHALNESLIEPDDILETIKTTDRPFKILFFGINGTGKTTTIAKLTHLLLKNNISCVLAAGDTFRAASIEQLQEHADKLKVKLIKQDYNADPAAVAFDAIKYAEAHKIKVVLIDTAGRMHTRENLLKEMEKISRVTDPDLKIFLAESIAGNDATEQAKAFNEMIGIDGIILSKADIDEKGGTVISVSHVTKKPIFYLGTGQKYEDLEPFNKEKFIEQLGL